MADNTLQTGSDNIATDDLTTLNGGGVSGVKVQRMKVGFGADGTQTDVTPNVGLPITGSQPASVSAASWTSATSAGTTLSFAIGGYNTVSLAIIQGSTLTAGAVTFELSMDNTSWVPLQLNRLDTFTASSTYTLQASTNVGWTGSVDAYNYFRVRLSTAIAGSGTVAIAAMPQTFAIEPTVTVGQSVASLLNATVSGTVTANIGNTANTTPILIRQGGSTTASGLLIAKILSAASTNSTLVLTGARAVYGYSLANTSASWRYVRFYNKATAPTVGTDSPIFVAALPPGGGSNIPKDGLNIPFSLGLGYSITGGAADLDTTVVAANDVVGTIWYV